MAVAVDIGSEYVAGWTYDTVSYESKGCYWTEGVYKTFQDLPPGTNYSNIAAIQYVPETGLYLAGVHGQGLTRTMCYWIVDGARNDTRYDLPYPEGVTSGSINGLFVDQSGVYVCGYYESGVDSQTIFHASDGVITDLAIAEVGRANGIAVQNGDVFVAGWTGDLVDNMPENTRAQIWKNGTQHTLSEGYAEAAANDIIVSGNHVAVGGHVAEDNTATTMKAAIWLIQDAAASTAFFRKGLAMDVIMFLWRGAETSALSD